MTSHRVVWGKLHLLRIRTSRHFDDELTALGRPFRRLFGVRSGEK